MSITVTPPSSKNYSPWLDETTQSRSEGANVYARFRRAEVVCRERTAVMLQKRESVEVSTFGELRSEAERVGAWLAREGIRPGERCAILAENHPRWCAAYLGILLCGAVVVPLDVNQSAGALAEMLCDSGSRVLFTSRTQTEKARAVAQAVELKIVLLGDECELEGVLPFPLSVQAESALPPCPSGADDVAVLLYTSGTTSDPKGVELTHGNLLAVLDGVMEALPMSEQDNILSILPLFHVLPQLTGLLIPLTAGATVVMLAETSTPEVMRAFRERGISAFCCVPQFFYLIHQKLMEEVASWGRLKQQTFRLLLAANGLARNRLGINLGPKLFRKAHEVLGTRMRLLVTGSARFDPAIGHDLHRLGFQILQGYGLTECSGVATVTRLDDNPIGSVGRPLAGVEIKILQGDGRVGSVGEVLVRGPNVMNGYHGRPGATGEALHEGWLHTGDLGRFGPHGHLYITGRSKEVIVLSSGKNVYPEEVEASYLRSPLLKEMCIVAKATYQGQALAEQLHAVVVPNMDVMRERGFVSVHERVRYELESRAAELPPHQRVLSFQLHFGELPRTTTRKLKRGEVQQLVAAGPTSRTRSWTEDESEWRARPANARALELIGDALQGEARGVNARNIHPLDHLDLDLGLDSLGRVELAVKLEQAFGVALPEGSLQTLHTVRELVDAVVSASAGEGGDAKPAEAGWLWSQVFKQGRDGDSHREQLKEPSLPLACLLFVLTRLVTLSFRVLLRFRVSGREHMPEAPAMLCPNHQSYLDALFVVGVLPFRLFRRLFFVGELGYFNTPWSRWVARTFRIVLVDTDVNIREGLQLCAEGLDAGKVLVIFPEGERSVDGELRPFRKGVAILSAHTRAHVVPVALDGAYKVWPRGRGIQSLSRVCVKFGEPLPSVAVNEDCTPAEAEAIYQAQLERLSEQVGNLLDELRRIEGT
ncbi:MAG: AMP-binding protein [Pyrinomonadaceae bacterium]